jgi:hypothetical protein
MTEPTKTNEIAARLLQEFLEFYRTPSFGSPSKRDIDVKVFGMLRDLGELPEESSLFQLAQRLKITRAKARGLLFDHEVRGASEDEPINERIRPAVAGARFSKDGTYFVFEVESPYLQALIRERVRSLGHISDSSFNTSLVRLSLDAATDLINSLLSADQRTAVHNALVSAGAPDASFKGVLKGALGALGKKFGGEALDSIAEDTVDYISDLVAPLLSSGSQALGVAVVDRWRDLFPKAKT